MNASFPLEDLAALEKALENESALLGEISFLENQQIYIYGAGITGKRIFDVLENYGIKPLAFLDRSASNKRTYKGATVFFPDDKRITPEERRFSSVLLALPLHHTPRLELKHSLKGWGFKNIYYAYPFFNPFANGKFDKGWKKRAIEVFKQFQDDESRNIYVKNIRANFSIEADARYAIPSHNRHYFVDDIFEMPPNLRFVDCGAYTGDTLISLMDKVNFAEAYAAFEPIYPCFIELKNVIKTLQGKIGNAVAFPSATGSQFGKILLSSIANGGNAVSKNGDIASLSVKLDDILSGFKPNFIKMDIEGSELNSLQGAQEIIKENRPLLAISIYHFVDHFWEIPSLIASWELGYKLYLRHHSDDWVDTVLYAVPETFANK